jgi:hypothetical protein
MARAAVALSPFPHGRTEMPFHEKLKQIRGKG